MSLQNKIEEDFITAFKARESFKADVLKLLKNSIKNKEIETQTDLKDEDIIKLLMSEVKKRKDSAQQYQDGGREDLKESELKEVEIIQEYLPEMASADGIKNIICGIINEAGIEKSPSNFGEVMKLAMSKLAGKAEGNLVSQVVKEELNK